MTSRPGPINGNNASVSAECPEKRLPFNVVDITYQINLEGVKELDSILLNKMIENFCKE